MPEISFNYSLPKGGQDKLESDEVLSYTDILCEGPIEGAVDKYGNLLNYTKKSPNKFSLGKGIYYNEVPLIDSRLNKFNFVNNNFLLTYGNVANIKDKASTVYKYDAKIYLNEINYSVEVQASIANSPYFYAFKQKEDKAIEILKVINKVDNKEYISYPKNTNSRLLTTSGPLYLDSYNKIINDVDLAEKTCRQLTHKIKNKYCNLVRLEFGIEQLFSTNKNGDVLNKEVSYAIKITSDKTSEIEYLVFNVVGVSRGNYNFCIEMPVEIDSISNEKKYINIIPLSQKILPTDSRNTCNISLTSITEIIDGYYFNYPYTVCAGSDVSSKHFSSDPNRSYDLKLLKIKIPSNYDAEAREYIGNWTGKFDSFLKWTDNPAWIYYDICTNTRYGLGNTNVTDEDLNKWELYKISKYCDALVKTQFVKYKKEDSFYIKDGSPNEKNCIYLENKYSYTLDDLRKKYNPVNGGKSDLNGGFGNSIIFLYDLIDNQQNTLETGFKKIVWNIEETSNGEFKFTLMNDFGPRKMFERYGSQSLFDLYNASIPTTETLNNNHVNTEFGAKNFILEQFKTNPTSYKNFINEDIFGNIDLDISFTNGKCYPRVIDYPDALEPRFSANILLNEETEILKLLNDFSSIFRGLTFYKNNIINVTIDVNKETIYHFNNSNVKNGFFNYSSGSLEGQYTVAKVLFKDKQDNFNDSVEIIEDTEMMKNYGIIVKDIIGFGVISRDQARRIGSWLLLTNRFENQMITFSTDLQGIYLKPSDIIRIKDEYRNDLSIQGRILNVDSNNLYVIVDRKVDLSFTDARLYFLNDFRTENSSQFDIKNSIGSFQIDHIENNTGKIYIKPSSDQNNDIEVAKKTLSLIKNTTPFIILKPEDSDQNLYKIISVSESDTNEYSISAIRHDRNKYKYLDLNYFTYKNADVENNTIILSSSTNIKEIVLPGISGGYVYYGIFDLPRIQAANSSSFYEFNLFEYEDSYDKKYLYMLMNNANVFRRIKEESDANTVYYKNIQKVLDSGGGLLFKLIYEQRSITYKMKLDKITNKHIFLGVSDVESKNDVNTSKKYNRIIKELKIYLFNQNDQIIEVDNV